MKTTRVAMLLVSLIAVQASLVTRATEMAGPLRPNEIKWSPVPPSRARPTASGSTFAIPGTTMALHEPRATRNRAFPSRYKFIARGRPIVSGSQSNGMDAPTLNGISVPKWMCRAAT
jgi:hypothetical protein